MSELGQWVGGKADGGQERLRWVAHILQSEVAEIPLPVTYICVFHIFIYPTPRNALFVRPFVGLLLFYICPHLTILCGRGSGT